MKHKSKIRKGDTVSVISGDHKGKIGKVIKVFPKLCRLVVEGVNLVNKRYRNSQGAKEVRLQEASIHISNVMFFDKELEIRTKLGVRVDENGTKLKVGKKTKKVYQLNYEK